MSRTWIRVGAVVRKELQEYRRNRSIVATMTLIPAIFVLNPLLQIFVLPASASGGLAHIHVLLYMLGIPAVVPAVVAAYAVVGERQQGSLEPILATPIPSQELLLGKAAAAAVPALLIAYAVFGAVLVAVEVFAAPQVAAALIQVPDVLAQVAFTPLVAGWSIWVGMAISTTSSDARVAQQLGTIASVPSAIVVVLIAYDVIHATEGLAIAGAVLLIVLNLVGWRITTALFDRERLITATR